MHSLSNRAATFFLGTLSDHPSGNLWRLVQGIIPLLHTQPKLQNFEAECEFAYASHSWKERLKHFTLNLMKSLCLTGGMVMKIGGPTSVTLSAIWKDVGMSYKGNAKTLAQNGGKPVLHGASL